MKDEHKILIGAIIVILIVLAGVFVLSGSGDPQPTVTPTALPATPTPTVIPGIGASETPSATPTATPVPTFTPTPMPESGVKLTEFGYWITYPPLGPQNWSDPKPRPEWNVVNFNRTSDSIPVANNMVSNSRMQVAVKRIGDMDGTVNVTINSSCSGNAREMIYVEAYRYSIYGDNLTYVGPHSYCLTFGPGVSEQIININLHWEFDEGASDGFVTLTIVGVDGGYTIGQNRQYTVSMVDVPTVFFVYDMGYIEMHGDEMYCSDSMNAIEEGDVLNVSLFIACSYVPGTLTVNFYGDPSYNMTGSDYTLYTSTVMDPGTLTGIVKVEIDKGLLYDGYPHQLDVYIADSEDYLKEDYPYFHIYINPR